jgi:hypothetical protein
MAVLPPLPLVINQVVYPYAGDVDDCWVVATLWGVRYHFPHIALPNIRDFRYWAGNPDRPGATGGNNGDIQLAINHYWPHAGFVREDRYGNAGWSFIEQQCDAGKVFSIALNSGSLPSTYRYGFYGAHRCGIAKRGGSWYIMNPLAPQGSRPRSISEADLKWACMTLHGAENFLIAYLFPPPSTTTTAVAPTGDPMIVSTASATSKYVLDLKRGQPIYSNSGLTRLLTRMSKSQPVTYLGLSGPARAVKVSTAQFKDHKMRTVIAYVPRSADEPRPR